MKKKFIYVCVFTSFFAFTQCSLFNFKNEPNIPGKLVLHFKEDEVGLKLFSMKANGENVRDLTNSLGFEAYYGSWTDNGDSLLFSSHYNGTTLGPGIFKTDTKGENTRGFRFNTSSTSTIPHPGLYPDQIGNEIFYQLKGSVYRLKLDDNSIFNITSGHDWFDYHYNFTVERESPNKVYTYSRIGRSSVFTVKKFDSKTGKVDSLTSVDGYVGDLSIRPDGKYLLYTHGGRIRGSLRILNVETKTEVPLELTFFQARAGNWNNSGSHFVIFAKQSSSSKTRMYYYKFDQESIKLIDVLENEYIDIGEGFDWYAD